MIGLKNLAKALQEELNSKISGFNFNIVSDTTNIKYPEKIGNEVVEYLNGVLTASTSDVTNLTTGDENTGLIYATQTCNLRLIVPLPNFESNVYVLSDGSVIEGDLPKLDEDVTVVEFAQGYAEKLSNVREALQSVFQGVSTGDITDDDGRIFSVTKAYSFTEGRAREQVPGIGDSFSFYATVYYSFVENGLNSRNMTFMLDGVILPAQMLTVFRTPTMDGNVYSNTKDGSVKNIASQSSFSATISMPAFFGNSDGGVATKYILDNIFNGKLNQAHLLTYKQGENEKTFLISFGENKEMGETIKNVGQTITLVECPDFYDLISFGKNFWIYTINSSVDGLDTSADGAQTYSFENKVVSTKKLALKGNNVIILQEGA